MPGASLADIFLSYTRADRDHVERIAGDHFAPIVDAAGTAALIEDAIAAVEAV